MWLMKTRHWRMMAVLMAVVALVQFAYAQRPVPGRESRTFSASDNAFRFSYPSDFQVCLQGKVGPCAQSYIPVCDQDALVCVVYPAKQFEDTSFGGASFQVKEILRQGNMLGPVASPNICVTPYPRKTGDRISDFPDFLISAEHPVEVIGGVQFLHGVSGGAAMSHWISIDLYRAFHKQRCFELNVSQTGTDPNVSDPPMKTLTPAQQKKLDQAMSQILHSFRFSN